jgi:fructan beta-fructosidase
VVKHAGRDPKLVWYAPGKHWVMAVYDETGGKRSIMFHTSPDLKTWTYRSKVDDFFECPDLFELKVQRGRGSKWVLYGADGKYLIGTFDGKTFTKESGKHQLWYGNFYAAQTFDNAPDGRRIQIGWAQGVTFPDMPFNQQMNIPVELTLEHSGKGKGDIRMFANPVTELRGLEGSGTAKSNIKLEAAPTVLVGDVDAGLLILEIKPDAPGSIQFWVRGLKFVYDTAGSLTCGKVSAPVAPDALGSVYLRMYIDRGSVEVFLNRGQAVLSVAHIAPDKERTVTAASLGMTIKSAAWVPMKSAWK